MLLAILPQGPAVAGVDIANVIAEILPALGAYSAADLDWCTQAELYQWADEAAKRLSHRAGAWVERDASTAVLQGTAQYPVPEGHVDTIHVSLGTTKLRATSAAELLALDASWQTATGSITRYSMNAGPVGTIVLYQVPTATGTLAVIFHQMPPQIADGSSAIAVASPLQDYFAYAMIEGARRKESDAAMPEMADHFAQRVSMYEDVVKSYWGAGQ